MKDLNRYIANANNESFKLLTPNVTNYSRHYILSCTLKIVNNTVSVVICEATDVEISLCSPYTPTTEARMCHPDY